MGNRRKKYSEKQLTVISGLVAGGVFLLLMAGIFLEYSHAASLSEEIDASKVVRADLMRKEAQIPQLRDEIESLEIEVERMAKILPNDQEIADLVKNLDKISESTREGDDAIKVTVFHPDEEEKVSARKKKAAVQEDSAFTSHPYMIQAQGNFYQMGRFVNQLENHIRFIKARSFMIALPRDKRLRDIAPKFITMKIVTYTYNHGKESTLQPDDKREVPEEIFKNKGFEFVRRSRRNPLDMPLVRLGEGESVLKGRLTNEQQSALLAQAEQMLMEMRQQIKMEMTEAALKNYIGIEEIYGKRFTRQQYFVRIGEIYAEAKRDIGEIKEAATLHAIMRSESAIKQMNQLFALDDYESVAEIGKRVKREIDGVKDFDDAQYREQLDVLARQAQVLADRAAIRLEMRGAGVSIKGFVRIGEPLAILEGDIYLQKGMTVTLNGLTFEVQGVDADREIVVLSYKGECIEVKGPGARPPVLPEDKSAPVPDDTAPQALPEDEDEEEDNGRDEPGGDIPAQPGLGRET